MALRCLSLCYLLLVANLPSSFHDEALNLTYFYPPHFTAERVLTASSAGCLQPRLIASSHYASGLSSFAVSKMDATCPQGLPTVASLGTFVRRQMLAELQSAGDVKIVHEPIRYFLDGHTAMVTLAAVTTKQRGMIYAAKACAVDDVVVKRKQKIKPTAPVNQVLCFDFTTQNGDLLDMMFSFIIQFGEHVPEPVFPVSARPRY